MMRETETKLKQIYRCYSSTDLGGEDLGDKLAVRTLNAMYWGRALSGS
jgi:hypothetical protein